MDNLELLTLLKKEFPSEIVNIIAGLDLIVPNIQGIDKSLWDKVGDTFKNDNAKDSYDYMEAIVAFKDVSKSLDGLILALSEKEKVKPKIKIPKPAEIEHRYTLNNKKLNNPNLKPVGFKIGLTNYSKATSWFDMYVGVCKALARIDEGCFRAFEYMDGMDDGDKKLYSKLREPLDKPVKILDNMYAATGFNTERTVVYIRRMVKRYNIPMSDVTITVKMC